jgi:hypothetical protein
MVLFFKGCFGTFKINFAKYGRNEMAILSVLSMRALKIENRPRKMEATRIGDCLNIKFNRRIGNLKKTINKEDPIERTAVSRPDLRDAMLKIREYPDFEKFEVNKRSLNIFIPRDQRRDGKIIDRMVFVFWEDEIDLTKNI